jgi:hypothetical protein
MSDWPKKMWLNTISGIPYASSINRYCIPVLVYRADQAPEPLTDEQCDEFRRYAGSFNDMVRHIYESGAASSHGRANEHFGNYYRKKFESLLSECSPFLKEGEPPAQRIARALKDIDGLLGLLAAEKNKTVASESAIRASERENARLNDELHSLTGGAWTTWQQERATLRELVREALGRNPPPGWAERAEKALEKP